MALVILRSTHDKELRGYRTEVPEGAKKLVIPFACGCQAFFKRSPWHEKEGEREVWVQSGFKFKYRKDAEDEYL